MRSRDEEIEDPGADPKGLAVPRNVFGGADQDTGQGAPRGGEQDAAGDDVGAGDPDQP
jgi:hypothetical protein